MRRVPEHTHQLDLISDLEDQAGGLLAAPDGQLWSAEDLDVEPILSPDIVEGILDELGVSRKLKVSLSSAKKTT